MDFVIPLLFLVPNEILMVSMEMEEDLFQRVKLINLTNKPGNFDNQYFS
ncbi:hypothetical protein DOT_5290 [Desulfosporosinus sp. OT]|nr:hypothetical protein DOT_5290 [Desulfosporosinus sp. OT]